MPGAWGRVQYIPFHEFQQALLLAVVLASLRWETKSIEVNLNSSFSLSTNFSSSANSVHPIH